MTTSYTQSLRLAQPQPGDPAVKNVWGTILDTDFSLIDNAINTNSPISITGQTAYTLTVANGAPDQARQAVLNITGALSAPCTVTLPNVPRVGWVVNNTSGGFSVTLSTGSGTNGVVPPDGTWRIYSCDGSSNVVLPGLTSAPSSALTGTSLNVSGPATISGATTINGFTNITNALSANVFSTSSLTASTMSATTSTVSGTLTASQIATGTLGSNGNWNVILNFITGGNNNGVYSSQSNAASGSCFLGNASSTASFYLACEFNSSVIGSIVPNSSGTGVTFNTASDARLKDVGEPIEPGKLIDRLKPVWFRWKSQPDGEPEPGFVAQQVHKIWPWSVSPGSGRPNSKSFRPWAIDAARLMPLVVAELQALRRRVAKLEKQDVSRG